ncbi:MAG: flagellar hook-length control protein FliK [Cognatishimia sp.]
MIALPIVLTDPAAPTGQPTAQPIAPQTAVNATPTELEFATVFAAPAQPSIESVPEPEVGETQTEPEVGEDQEPGIELADETVPAPPADTSDVAPSLPVAHTPTPTATPSESRINSPALPPKQPPAPVPPVHHAVDQTRATEQPTATKDTQLPTVKPDTSPNNPVTKPAQILPQPVQSTAAPPQHRTTKPTRTAAPALPPPPPSIHSQPLYQSAPPKQIETQVKQPILPAPAPKQTTAMQHIAPAKAPAQTAPTPSITTAQPAESQFQIKEPLESQTAPLTTFRTGTEVQGTPTQPTHSAPTAQTAPRQIITHLQQANTHQTELHLAPEELGRVRLTLHTTEQGLTLTIQAERSETSDLLRRHMADLSQEFADLGYSDINFSFADQDRKTAQDTSDAKGDGPQDDEQSHMQSQPLAPQAHRPMAAGSGLDIRL